MVSAPQWLSRYRDGQRQAVWLELRQLGAAVRDPQWAPEAQAVCDEMARRARRNVEMVVERLTADGYRFRENDGETPAVPHIPPTRDAEAHIDWLVRRFEAVPMTLISWMRIVGDVSLIGDHAKWSTAAAADPLVIEAEGSLSDWPPSERFDWHEERYPGSLILAPDRFHKANVSGGGPYGMVLPDACADGVFHGEVEMPFVSYLNWVFRKGGFPYDIGNGWTDADKEQAAVSRRLAGGLLRL